MQIVMIEKHAACFICFKYGDLYLNFHNLYFF